MEDIQYKTEQAELSVRSVISETKKDLSNEKKRLNKILRSEEFDYNDYFDCQSEIEALEKGLEKANKFLSEMF